MKLLLLVELDVDQAEVDKLNEKRARLGRAKTTGLNEAENVIGSALQHNFLFDDPKVMSLNAKLDTPDWLHGCGNIFTDPEGVVLQCGKCQRKASE